MSKLGKKCDECHQNKQETVDIDLPDGTTVVCRECVEALVEQFQAEEAMMPQPEQEPVAWKVIDGANGEFMFSRVKPMERTYKYDVVIPLYTAPPKREPLSSIKILELTSKHEYAINLIRAVEKAHGIGGGK